MVADNSLTPTEWASRGGKARANSLSPKRRKEIAKKAAIARWGKKSRKKKEAA